MMLFGRFLIEIWKQIKVSLYFGLTDDFTAEKIFGKLMLTLSKGIVFCKVSFFKFSEEGEKTSCLKRENNYYIYEISEI